MVFHNNQFSDPCCFVHKWFAWNFNWELHTAFVTDDTREVIANSNIVDFQSNIKAVLEQLNCLIWTSIKVW